MALYIGGGAVSGQCPIDRGSRLFYFTLAVGSLSA